MLKHLAVSLCCFMLAACSKPTPPSQQMQMAALGLNAAAISADGTHTVIGSMHHGISLWRTDDRERLFDWSHREAQDTVMVAADFSPDGRWALTGDSHTLALWDVQSGRGMRFWQAPGAIESLQLGPNGNTALLGLQNNTAVLFDVRRGGVIHTFHHNAPVRSVAISDDGTRAITGSEDATAVVWNLVSGEALHKMRHQDEVQLVAISPDAQLVMSMSKYDRASVWSASTGETVGELPLQAERLKRGQRFTAARFSADNRWLLTGRPGGLVTLWQVEGLQQQAQWSVAAKNPWKPSATNLVDVAFSTESGRYLAAASNGSLYVLQLP